MAWICSHGTGVTVHGIERRRGGRVEFTTWACVLWVPLLPLRSWSAVYLGEGLGDGISDESYEFGDLRRIPHDWGRVVRTFTRSLLVVACAVAPAYVMAFRVSGRAATPAEMVAVFASTFWAAGVVFWAAHVRRRSLRGDGPARMRRAGQSLRP